MVVIFNNKYNDSWDQCVKTRYFSCSGTGPAGQPSSRGREDRGFRTRLTHTFELSCGMALGVGLLLSRLLGVHIERVGLNGLTGLVAYGVELDGMCIRSEQVKIQLVLWAFISNVFTRTTNRELLRITLCDVSLRVVNEADTTHVIERARSFVGRASRLRFIRFEADQISIHSAPVASRLGKTLEVKGVALGGQATDLDQSDKGLDTILRQVAQSMLFQEGTRRSYLMRSPWKAAANTRWVWTAADGSFAFVTIIEPTAQFNHAYRTTGQFVFRAASSV